MAIVDKLPVPVDWLAAVAAPVGSAEVTISTCSSVPETAAANAEVSASIVVSSPFVVF